MRKFIIVVLLLCFLGVFGYAIYNIYNISSEHNEEMQVYNDLDNIINQANQTVVINTPMITVSPIETNLPEITTLPNISIDKTTTEPIDNQTNEPTNVEVTAPVFSKAAWRKLKEINNDFIGYLAFDTGSIKEPVVQSFDNNYYLYKNIYKEQHNHGTVFMNYLNKLDDMNLVLYGHNNRNSYWVKFASLNKMYNDTNYYRENAYFNFYLENEVRRYVICYVFMRADNDSGFDHQTTNFTEEMFNNYFKYVKINNTVNSIDQIEFGDNFITLQTCKRGNRQYRIVVIAKEIGRFNYN